VQELLAPLPVGLDESWGLDHGTWSVFRHVYHDAGVPIVQLSIDGTQPAAFHFELGNKLAVLRNEGILIAGSGNLVHNLRKYDWGRHMPEPYDWAVRFERKAKEQMLAGDYKALIHYENLGQDALLSIPTPDHYLPLLYILATRQERDDISFPVEGIEGGSMSMLTLRIG
jgi:4,5-DOPA dioxygenase extradiol